MGKGILGGIFDLNRDGQMSPFESGLEFQFLNDVLMAEKETDEDEEDPEQSRTGFGWGGRF